MATLEGHGIACLCGDCEQYAKVKLKLAEANRVIKFIADNTGIITAVDYMKKQDKNTKKPPLEIIE